MKRIIKKIYFSLGGKQNSKLKLFIYNIPHGYIVRKRLQKRQKQVGVELLSAFFEACKSCGIPCWLEFGTLLGAYREKSFIPHDFDLDCGIFADDYTIDLENALLRYGFRKTGFFYRENINTGEKILNEITIEYKRFKLDVFLSQKGDDGRHVSVFVPYEFQANNIFCKVKEYHIPGPCESVYVEIDGSEFASPGDPVKCLSGYYGQSFMIPNPNWETASEKNEIAINVSDLWRGIGYICSE